MTDRRRFFALMIKELRQIRRDPYSLAVGIGLPIVLLLLFGYGMSMDLKNVKLVLAVPENSPAAVRLRAAFDGSEYFAVTIVPNAAEARTALVRHRADAALLLPVDFQRKLASGVPPALQLAVNAVNANQARLIEGYVQGVLAGVFGDGGAGPVVAVPRIWFNEANDSRYYLVPGVIVIIMTLIGTMLTSLVMAREYEHGNLECLFISPVRPHEILLAKACNNFLLGIAGLLISLAAVRWLFGVPMRGSVALLLAGSALYLLVSLALGLVISSVARSQFVACEMTLSISFMPAFLLSGFLYDIGNMPVALQYLTLLIPARFYVEFLQTVMLAGNVWSILLRDLAALALFAVLLLAAARYKNPKRLE